MRRRSRLLCLLLLVIMFLSLMPTSALAWETETNCEYFGKFIADDWICDGGDHCSKNAECGCYDEHHCPECDECVDELCGSCGLCENCATHCQDCGRCDEEAIPCHTHNFGVWLSNADGHWKTCGCGERADVATLWKIDKEATRSEARGVHRLRPEAQ